MANPNELYDILGVSPTASLGDIKRAFRQQAREHHPDKNPNDVDGATERFKRLQQAYEILGNPTKRAQYDIQQQQQPPPQPTFVYDDAMNEVVIQLYHALLQGYEEREFTDEDAWNTLLGGVGGAFLGGLYGHASGGDMAINALLGALFGSVLPTAIPMLALAISQLRPEQKALLVGQLNEYLAQSHK
jgi:predicted lipid-binding transport protein (Tim44 family)